MILLHGITFTTKDSSNGNKYSEDQHIFKMIGLDGVIEYVSVIHSIRFLAHPYLLIGISDYG